VKLCSASLPANKLPLIFQTNCDVPSGEPLRKDCFLTPWQTQLKACLPPFSSSSPLIFQTVTGEHSFIAPDFDAGDQRGPCPGLNALANHGYIGRNGVTSVSRASSYLSHLFKTDEPSSLRRPQLQSTKYGEWVSTLAVF
jgi:hypothetical protein